jgi:DNA-binding transcriptional MerR regulator
LLPIGERSKQTGVKVPTIRDYEQMGLFAACTWTPGNQRRYGAAKLEQLGFLKHARDLGFSIEAIGALIDVQDHSNRNCGKIHAAAEAQLRAMRGKIGQLRKLEDELERIVWGCDGAGPSSECYALARLVDHGFRGGAH